MQAKVDIDLIGLLLSIQLALPTHCISMQYCSNDVLTITNCYFIDRGYPPKCGQALIADKKLLADIV